MKVHILQFLNLSERHPGVTHGISLAYAEAARVCLDRHHIAPIIFKIVSPKWEKTAVALWPPADERTKNAWANDTDATESGAYGIALAGVEVGEGLVAMSRAETRTGADYYVAPPNTRPDDLESYLRLEVSGVDNGDQAAINQRLQNKINQTLRGASNLPALAAVVGFAAQVIAVERAE